MEATISAQIKGLLLLTKSENVTKNVLGILGLNAANFPGGEVQIMWDDAEITVQSKTTIAEHDAYAALVAHKCLVDMDSDDDGIVWTFQWPRNIQPYHGAIVACFPELGQEVFWGNFKKAWYKITGQMPEPREPLSERTESTPAENPVVGMDLGSNGPSSMGSINVATEGEDIPPEPRIPEDLPQAPSFDDLDFDSTPAKEEAPALALTTTAEPDSKIEVVHGAGDPSLEAAAQAVIDAQEAKRGRGRPPLTPEQKAAREAEKGGKRLTIPSHETHLGSVAPVETAGKDGPKKVIPACVKFAEILEEEFARLRAVAQCVKEAEAFPMETIKGLKSSLDRLALRAAHMEFRGAHDADDPNAINPLVEVTLANVTAVANTATRDLGLAPERPKAWEDFKKNLKEAVDLADDMCGVMSQMGAGPAVQEPPRLKDGEGRSIVG